AAGRDPAQRLLRRRARPDLYRGPLPRWAIHSPVHRPRRPRLPARRGLAETSKGIMPDATYQLWNLVSNNIVDEYSSEDEALGLLRGCLEREGPEEIERLAMTPSHGEELQAIAAGQ